MPKVKLLNNLPIEDLTSDTDYLGLIDKGNLITSFLKGNIDQFSEIKMFTLYGEWGSGKSSLMKYIQKELKEDFNTYFFEAWEFEKDENLAMSLLEFIDTNSQDSGEPFYKNVLKYGGRILRGLAKTVKVNAPLYPNGPSLELDATGLIDELNQKENLTFYQVLYKFKKEFVIMEDRIKAQTGKDYNIVFIDDLDRCEPEQVLNLLSAIKLFFTYGRQTIFFCGIDKKAVEEAVRTKYGEIVKSNEYLEKIFDISFKMTRSNDILKLTNICFDETYFQFDENRLIINAEVNNLFQHLRFTNPRKIKKVFNKYSLLCNLSSTLTGIITPNLFIKNGKNGNLFETVLTLYLIILHEFYHKSFQDFLNLKMKIDFLYKEHEKKRSNEPSKFTNLPYVIKEFNKCDISNTSFIELYNIKANNVSFLNNRNYFKFFCEYSFPLIFAPVHFDELAYTPGRSFSDFQFLQLEKTIDNLFYDYIKERYYFILSGNEYSGSSFKSVKEFVDMAL